MSNFAISYIVYRSLYQIIGFLRHWYVDSFYAASSILRRTLSRFDRVIALRITLRHFFEPLYQDYTFVGYVLGILFRSARAIAGIVLYGIILAIGLAGYGLWCLIPVFLAYKTISSL